MDEIKITQGYLVYNVKVECIIPVKESEWMRLKRMIKSIKPHKKIFQLISSNLWGVFASAVFSIIAFHPAENLDGWVLPTIWAILSVSLFLAVCLLILDSQQNKIISNSAESILGEMDLIELSLELPSDAKESPTVKK